MNKFLVTKSFFSAALLFVAGSAIAQKGSNPIWKKQVAREIDMREKEDTKVHHLKDVTFDTTLAEMITSAAKSGKIAAYSNFDHVTKLTKIEVDQILFGDKPDTVTLTDPIDKHEIQKIIYHDFNFDAVHKYRILEDWSFNTATGNTDIHIVAVAPVREIYGEAGDFRGVQAMYWVHYTDILDILARYEHYHPNNTFAGHIWDDYFLSEVKPKAEKK